MSELSSAGDKASKSAPDAPGLTAFAWASFLAEEQLPASYQATAEQWFLPLVTKVVAQAKQSGPGFLLGINGSQGSGKSTLASFLARAFTQCYRLTAVTVSIDDFYLPKDQRAALAKQRHPLLATRGVPGTHDVDLMAETLNQLRRGTGSVAIPRFDKAADDRTDAAQWHQVGAPVDVVIWEGWCLGVPPQPEHLLSAPVNALESEEDSDGIWRQFANDRLAGAYRELFDQVDLWVMLAAPGFDCVWQWRCEQEAKLAANVGSDDKSGLMSPAQIERFIQFYQRLTEWGLQTLPESVDFLYRLDQDRSVQSLSHPKEGARQ